MAKKLPKSVRKNIIKKLDEVFSQYIRLRDSFQKWEERYVKCPLCWNEIHRKKAQNMHFISRWILKYRFSERNCHAGCMTCNVIKNWNYILYTRRMQKEYWVSYVDSLINDKTPFSISTAQLEKELEYYTEKRDKLLAEYYD